MNRNFIKYVLIVFVTTVIPFSTEGRNNQQIILLVHGITMNPDKPTKIWSNKNWNGMIGFLQNKGLRFGGIIKSKNGRIKLPDSLDKSGDIDNAKSAQLFSLEFSRLANTDGLAYKCLELANCINELKKYTGYKKITLIAHSAGGLIARVYLQKALPLLKYDINSISKLITIGSPHFGSAFAKSFCSFIGIQANSLKPEAELIQTINSSLQLPEKVLFASIIVRGFAADVRGSGTSYDPYINQKMLLKLPVDFRQGGDQIVHVKSQNLALTKCATNYEKKTHRPVLYFIARVPDPSPKDSSFFEEKVHCFAPYDLSVQNLVYYLISDEKPWLKLKKDKLKYWIDTKARIFSKSVIENETLLKHPLSEVTSIELEHFSKVRYNKNNDSYIFTFEGYAISIGKILRIMSRKTFVKGIIECKFDVYGRILNFSKKIISCYDTKNQSINNKLTNFTKLTKLTKYD